MSSTYYDSEEVRECFDSLRRKYEQQSHDGRAFVLFKSFMQEFEAKYNPWQVVDDAHAKYSDAPPDINSGVFQSNRVFYILLQLGHVDLVPFFRRVNDSLLPIDRNVLEGLLDEHGLRERLGDKWKEVLDEFCRAQTAWCPLSFSELSIQWEERVSQSRRIVPFYRQTLIQPCGAGQRPSEDRARLYEVHIPKELVSSRELNDSDLLKESDLSRPFYRFALKQFPESLKFSYDKEVKAFRALGKQPGMVRYYGCYEAMGDNNQPSTYNMILEYADYDLNGAMVKEAPPVSPSEIKSFWESMCKLSTALCEIHHLDVFGKKYDVWHGDIKPENILCVGDNFKLADPGDSSIQRAQEDQSLPPKAEVYGGTRTYGAPEKSQLLEAATDTAESTIFQNSDVWSLGCVLSIASTYVVLGRQGVVMYERLRQAHQHSGSNEGLRQDVFHDNQKVLDEVTDWHKYLRKAARVGDHFTAKILDLVDNHMLVMPPEDRWDAKKVSDHFGKLIKREVDAVPGNIEFFLQNLDLEAEIEEESERGIHRLDSDGAKKHFQEKQQSKANSGPGRPQFESEKRLLGTKIQPTAQRSVRRPDLLRQYSQSVPLPTPNATTSDQSASRISIKTNAVPPSNSLPVPEPLTVFQLKDELEERHKSQSLFGNRYKSAKGRVLNDPLMPHYEDRDIIFLVDNGSSMTKWWSEAKMVIEVLAWRVLGYDSDGIELYFTNPETKTSVSGSRGRKNNINDVLSAMNEAQPRRPGPEGQGYVRTNLYDRLVEIMPKSLSGKSKTVIILTDGLWEGMPYDEYIDRYMKESLCRLAGQDPNTLSPSRLSKTSAGVGDWRDYFEMTRPVTLQFIAFGYKGDKGWVRMERLDDMLEEQGLPDLIDMEPSHGDAHKMLLGSLCSHWDRHEHKAHWPQSVMSPSPSICGTETPSSSAPASGFPSINGVHRQQTITDDSQVPVSPSGYSSSHGQSSPSSFPPSPDNQSIYSVATSPPGTTGSFRPGLLSPRNYSTFGTDDRVDRSPSPDPSQRRRFRNSVPSFGIRRQLSKGRSSPN